MSLLFAGGLCVFLWNFLSCVAVEPLCKEEEFSVGDHCCPMCNPDMGLVTWRECSSREDTVCRCIPGYFCETQEGDHCTTCLPLTNCSLGQRVLERGNYSQDTVCADCPAGTFSPGSRPAARELEPLQRQKQHNTVKLPVAEVGSAAIEEETAFNRVNSG